MTQYRAGQTALLKDTNAVEVTLDRLIPEGEMFAGEWKCRLKSGGHGIFPERDLTPLGPVRTETVTKRHIVPGVYGRVRVVEAVSYDPHRKVVGLDWLDRDGHPATGGVVMTAEELDSLAMVASQLAEALRDA